MSSQIKLIIIALSFLLAAGIALGIVLPTAKKIKNLNDDIYNQRVSLEKLYLRGQSLKTSRENYEQVKEQIRILNNIFLQEGQELEFITALEKIAEKNKVKQIINIKNDEKNKEVEQNGYKAARVDLNLNGTFPHLLSYLNEIQTLDAYFNLDYLNFYGSEARPFGKTGLLLEEESGQFKKSSLSPEINLTLSGLTYWR